MFGLGIQEIVLILILILIFFGAEKFPQLARSLGKGLSEFHRAQQEVKEELLKEASTPEPPGEPEQIVCPSCGGRTAADSLFCSRCGQRLERPPACSICQRRLQPDEKFCPNCGQQRSSW